MDIRARLRISNALMVAIPVAVALVFGLVCFAALWLWMAGGTIAGSEVLENSLKATITGQVGADDLKILSVLALLAVLTVAIVVALLANRFVTRFVIDNVVGPLDMLSTGVGHIREGNLDYRISYSGCDEFRPVCDAFDEMAARLQESVERDRETDEARKRLIAGFSHDIRSPLTCIKGYAEGLRDGVADSASVRERYIGVIIDKADEVQRMSSRMLELAKLDMEAYQADLHVLDLQEYVEAYVAKNAESLRRDDVRVELALEEAPVVADATELDRIMANVIENSARYRVGDSTMLTIRTECEQRRCLLSVSDDGPGVSQKDLSHLFEPMFRADAARTRCEEGSGLGLALVAAAAKKMGAGVRADNAPGGGLLLELSFPQITSDTEGE